MKRFFTLLCLSLICLTSCGQTQNEAVLALKQGLVQSNKRLPITAAFFTMEKMEIKGNDYIIHCTIDEEQMDLDQYLSNMIKNKSNLFTLAAGNNKDFADLFAESGLNLKFMVTGKQSKRKGVITLSAEEIKNTAGNDFSARDFMKETVEDMQRDLPEDWGDGLTLTSVYIDGNYICYTIKTDESFITIPLLKRAKEEGTEMEEGILEEFSEVADVAEKLFVKYLKDSGMGIKYIYLSKKTAESVSFTVTPEMIKSSLGD